MMKSVYETLAILNMDEIDDESSGNKSESKKYSVKKPAAVLHERHPYYFRNDTGRGVVLIIDRHREIAHNEYDVSEFDESEARHIDVSFLLLFYANYLTFTLEDKKDQGVSCRTPPFAAFFKNEGGGVL